VVSRKVLVVDDHRLFAEAIAVILLEQAGTHGVFTADCLPDADHLFRTEKPNLLIVDVHLPDASGIEFVKTALEQDDSLRALIISGDPDPSIVVEALRSGAQGFVRKVGGTEELIEAVRTVERGETFLSPALLAPVIGELLSRQRTRTDAELKLATLSSRERQVLECLVEGLDRAAIAERLFISMNTVRTHAQNVFAKLQVHSSIEAVAIERRSRSV
jgi:DNA-binding NarL/FixJ family response regulator